MMHTRARGSVPVDPAAVARRIELRLADWRDVDTVERELTSRTTVGHLAAPRFSRRDHVQRLDVELTGDAAAVDGVVRAVADWRPRVQIMRDEVAAPTGTHDPVYPDMSVWRRVGAPVERGPLGKPLPPLPPGQGEIRPDRDDDVIVAIVDSGVMTTHPDLEASLSRDQKRRLQGRNVLVAPDDARSTDVEDDDGHGTLLAGTVLTAANRSRDVRLLPVKFFDGRTRPDSKRAAEAIGFAVGKGAKIILLAWEVGLFDEALRRAIARAGEQDALVVVAAGNSGADNDARPAFPACYGHDGCQALPEGSKRGLANVVTVMASDRLDDQAGFSNYGKESVHIAAPGVRMISTHETLRGGLRSGDPELYQPYYGTSAAAAFVAGAAALLKSKARKLTPDDIKNTLRDTADARPDLRCWAKGRINVGRALDQIS